MTLKAVTFIVFHEDFNTIMVNRKKFWQLDSMGAELGAELKRIRKYFVAGFKIYICLLSLIYFALVVKAVFFHEMPFPCWLPEGEYWKTGVTYYQLSLILYAVVIVTTFDFMFCASYLEAYLQLKLLNRAFSNMKTINDVDKCKNYQNFIFKLVSEQFLNI